MFNSSIMIMKMKMRKTWIMHGCWGKFGDFSPSLCCSVLHVWAEGRCKDYWNACKRLQILPGKLTFCDQIFVVSVSVLHFCFDAFQIMEQVDSWKFNVFELESHTNNRPLAAITYTILRVIRDYQVWKNTEAAVRRCSSK